MSEGETSGCNMHPDGHVKRPPPVWDAAVSLPHTPLKNVWRTLVLHQSSCGLMQALHTWKSHLQRFTCIVGGYIFVWGSVRAAPPEPLGASDAFSLSPLLLRLESLQANFEREKRDERKQDLVELKL